MTRNELLIQLSESLNVFVKNMHVEAAQNGHDELKEALGASVTPALKHVLMIIGSDPEMNVKQLASLLQITSGAVTQHIAALEKLGAVERVMNDKDRREVMLQLTDHGRELMAVFREHMLRGLEIAFEELTDEELGLFVQLMTKANHKYEKGTAR